MAPPDLAYEPTLWLATRRDEDGVEIRIRDNGNGIAPDIADKIFNPFFTTKPTDKGTGLGLAISNDIVRQHGGAIRVDTQHGEFTEMTIQLPSKPGCVWRHGYRHSTGSGRRALLDPTWNFEVTGVNPGVRMAALPGIHHETVYELCVGADTRHPGHRNGIGQHDAAREH